MASCQEGQAWADMGSVSGKASARMHSSDFSLFMDGPPEASILAASQDGG